MSNDPAPQHRVNIPGSNLAKPILISGLIVAVGIFWGLSLTPIGVWFPMVITGLFLSYVFFRSKRDVKDGWFLEEDSGNICWYVGASECRVTITELQKIDRAGMVTLKSGKTLWLPAPDRDFLPVYVHLYEKYPYLFESKPIENSRIG